MVAAEDAPAGAVRVRVPGKINLALRVGPRRPDGYHELATLFQAVSLCDELSAAPAADGRITVAMTGQAAGVGSGLGNLAVRAAHLLRERYGDPSLGADLAIRKAIPVAGGMAGGSADGAAALVACARLWGLGVGRPALLELAGELGADVPFALLGGCAHGLGRGDRVTPVLSRGVCHWVLALAAGGLSTAHVFQRFDERGDAPADTPAVPPGLLTALASGDTRGVGRHLVNDLTPAALALAPGLRRTLAAGLELGALGAIVSGSGPTVALLAADADHADRLAVAISSEGVAHRVLRVHGPVPGAQVIR
ncbi:MAG: 4-(cytidine 5'-diphospho)-2-C-methyl-D-erythritol kinase [Propionibacteriaceae bacterium]|nr:4-(cytidine 5'-diphospho)-2-C-methyl-D-erythritol kinase [Propionibacteriaceae bacterium]